MDDIRIPPPLPRARQNVYREDPEYLISMVGMASDSAIGAMVDGRYAIIQIHPTDSIVLAPLVGQSHPSFEAFVFYTHCLSYEHDIPAFIYPSEGRALVTPIARGRNKCKREQETESYFGNLEDAYRSLNSIRFGSMGYIEFRWSDYHRTVDLQYTARYANAAKELSIYSTALRQLDPLSEYLSYYRVIESVAGDNGKKWIASHLSHILNVDFGFLAYAQVHRRRQRRTNLFSVYRRRALSRLRALQSKLIGITVEKYLYNETRCGIAHGGKNTKVYDFGLNIEEISKDVYIAKLLARIAIDSLIDKTVRFPRPL